MKRYTALYFALLLAAVLAACASLAPEYGKVVTPTEPPATSTLEATSTPIITPTPTPRPDAKELAEFVAVEMFTFGPDENIQESIDQICAIASEYGCWLIQKDSWYVEWKRGMSQHINQPVVDSAGILYEGTMSDGTEYQIWWVNVRHSNSPWPGTEVSTTFSAFVWSESIQQWLYFHQPDVNTAKSVGVCGQFLEYHPDGSYITEQSDWDKVFSNCQTATPLPPTPFAPVTPVFTPTP